MDAKRPWGEGEHFPVLRSDTGGSAAGPRSGSSTYPQGIGRQAVLGGPELGVIDQGSLCGVARQAARPMEDGKGAVWIVVDTDLGPDEVRAQRTWRQLQRQAAIAHGVVITHDTLLLDAQDVGDGARMVDDELRSRQLRLDGEAGVVARQVDLADEAVGGLLCVDPGQAELLGQAVPGLRRGRLWSVAKARSERPRASGE